MAAIVDYSDSDSESGSNVDVSLGNRLGKADASFLPSLPITFRDLYSTPTRTSTQDDPNMHEGRKRAIPHIAGNWPTHVYLEWYPLREEAAELSTLISRFQAQLQNGNEIYSLIHSDLGVELPLHISLSRPVVLKSDECSIFSKLLGEKIRDSTVNSFSCHVEGTSWESNLEKNRWFLVLRVISEPEIILWNLLKISNDSLSTFHQPALYEPRHQRGNGTLAVDQSTESPIPFHISIAWSPYEPPIETKRLLDDVSWDQLPQIKITFTTVKLKFGNQIVDIALA